MISNSVWTRIKREHGLYRYNPSGQYFARVRFKGKLYRRKLAADDLALAKRKFRAFKDDLERTGSPTVFVRTEPRQRTSSFD